MSIGNDIEALIKLVLEYDKIKTKEAAVDNYRCRESIKEFLNDRIAEQSGKPEVNTLRKELDASGKAWDAWARLTNNEIDRLRDSIALKRDK